MKSKKLTNPTIKKPDTASKSKKGTRAELKSQTSGMVSKPSKAKISPPTKEGSSFNSSMINPRRSYGLFNEKYLLDTKNYKSFAESKEGGFGTVYFVQHIETGKKYAAKTNRISSNSQNYRFVLREVNILIKIQNPTIVEFHGISYSDFEGNNKLTIFMKYMEMGALSSLLSKERKSRCPLDYDDTKRQIILAGIARGMMFLHQNNIMHRDLKPDNVLLDNEYKPCITDFGLSKFFDSNDLQNSMFMCGTLPYMAPELFISPIFDSKVDVYAFGILMYEVVTGRIPYKIRNTDRDKENFKKQVKNGMRPELANLKIKKGFKKMMKACWSDNPDERPTFSEIYSLLSLSSEEYYVDSINNICQSTINDIPSDDEDKQNDIDNDEDDQNKTPTYCFNNVDLDEFLIYIEDINSQTSSFSNQELLQKMDEKIKELKTYNKKIEDKVDSLSKDNKQLKNEITQLKNEIAALKNDNASQNIRIEPPSSPPSIKQPHRKPNVSQGPSQEDIDKVCLEIKKKARSGSLTKIELPNILTEIPEKLFLKCRKLKEVKIPSSVTSIGYGAFKGCSSLTSIEIPSSVTIIRSSAFEECSSLESVDFPSSLIEIGASVFEGCSLLKSVEIPSSVTKIGFRAFYGCSSLTNIEIPSSVTKIENSSFRGCSSLTNIEIPSSIEEIEYSSFEECSSLTSIKIPPSIIEIAQDTFYKCSSLKSIEIPSSVVEIGYRAFYECSSLSSIEIPSSVGVIGYKAFYGCSSLTGIEIPSSLIEIKYSTFEGCSSLTSVEIPSSVKSIEHSAFKECSSLKQIKIPSSLNNIGENAFPDETNVIKY